MPLNFSHFKIQNPDVRGAVFVGGLACALIFYSGCNEQGSKGDGSTATPTPTATPRPTATPSATPTATPTPSPTATPASTEAQMFSLQVNFPALIYAPLHKVETDATDWTKSCQVDTTPTNTTVKDIYCISEVGQLDLWEQDFTIKWNAPLANCPYVIENPYWFSQFQPGVGPAKIRYNTDAAGAPNSLECDYGAGYTTCTDAQIISTGTSSKVVCGYDYSSYIPLKGPNCCEGYYQETVTDTTPSTTTRIASWGGYWGACAAGPGAGSTYSRDNVHKLPLGTITPAYGGGTGTIEVKAPQSRMELTNLSVANYHSDPTPFPVPNPNPLAPITSTVSGYPIGNQWYEYGCYDGAYRLLGRIRLMVRKWNMQSELNKGGTGDWTKTEPTATPFPIPYKTLQSWEEFTGPTPASNAATFPKWGI